MSKTHNDTKFDKEAKPIKVVDISLHSLTYDQTRGIDDSYKKHRIINQ